MTFHDRQVLQRILAQDAAVGGVFDRFLKVASPLLARYRNGSGGIWSRNATIERQIDKELERLKEDLEALIVGNQEWAWAMSNTKNDSLVKDYIRGMSLPQIFKAGLFNQNAKALNAFIGRKEGGMTVSDRVWNIAEQTKRQLEFYLESGIGAGQSAAGISHDIRQLLRNPDKTFRRVRDKNGKLVPSQPMKDFNPGQGVYRSPARNAMRLAATETNMAYRTADHLRWQQLDFVVGIEVELSNAHPREDICNHMAGKYPKDFKFTGWHPFCLCHAVPVIIPHENFLDYLDMDDDEAITFLESHAVKQIPVKAKSYLKANRETFDRMKSKPIWFKDNFQSPNRK